MDDPISTEAEGISKPVLRRGRPMSSPKKIAGMKEKIATEARALFLADGYRAISMRRIAAGVGCTPMSLYSYYPSKIDILRHLWADLFEALFADLEFIASQTLQPAARLKLISLEYVNYWLKNPEHYRIIFMTEGISQPDVNVFVHKNIILDHYSLFHTLIGSVISAEDSEQNLYTQALICALNGIAHNLITISGYTWSKSDQLVTIVVEGLIARIGGDQSVTA